eukprot:gene8416-9901_t
MDLLRALDVLSTSPIDTDDQTLRKEKIEACRTIAEQICAPTIRNTADFPRFLSIAISLLLRAHGDKDLNVYSVAEESLNRRSTDSSGRPRLGSAGSSNMTSLSDMSSVVTPPPTPSGHASQQMRDGSKGSPNPNNVLSAANAILSKPFPLKSQRIALAKFGEVCSYIRPAKSRKYITSLVAPLNHLLAMTSDEALQEGLATAMENIARVLVAYLRDAEAVQFVELFTRNLAHTSAAVRRSASFSIVAITRHYPRALHEHVIDALHTFATNAAVVAEHPSNKTLGVLFTFLQLVKLADGCEMTREALSAKLPFFLSTIVRHLRIVEQDGHDHNIVGASLDLLQQLLCTFGDHSCIWAADTVGPLITQLRGLAFGPTPLTRVSLKAVVINCLAQLVKFFPRAFHAAFFFEAPGPSSRAFDHLSVSDITFKLFSDSNAPTNLASSTASTTSVSSSFTLDAAPKDEFLAYLNDADPLLRGSTAFLIGCMIRGFLGADYATSNNIYPATATLLQEHISVPYLMAYLLRSLLDASSITAKLACTGIGECLPTLSLSRHSEWALVALRHLLCVSSATYWLVKLEILETLSAIDYVVIEYLEQNIQQKAHVLCTSSPSERVPESGGAIAIPVQPKVLDFLITQLGDNDFRVRNSAGNALLNIIPNLVFTAPLERRTMKGIAAKVCETFDVPNYENTMLPFVGDLLPLALDRVGIVTWIATDFDLHIDIIDMFAHLSRGAENVLGSYCQNVLRHLARMVNIMKYIVAFFPTPPLKEMKLSSSSGIANGTMARSSNIGAFTHSIHFIKVYARLLAVRTNSITIFGADKFTQLRAVAFDAMAVLLRCAGKSVLPHAEELVGYFSAHFEQEPRAVTTCIGELFLVAFRPTPLAALSNASVAPARRTHTTTTSPEARSLEAQQSDNAHDQSFANTKSVFGSFLSMGVPHATPWLYDAAAPPSSHSLNTAYSTQEVARILAAEDKRSLYKQFEPLIAGAMLEYQATHDVPLKRTLLALLAKLARFGVDLTLFDKEQHFAVFLLDELRETHCLLRSPVAMLPALYDALGAIILFRRQFNEQLPHTDDLKRILGLIALTDVRVISYGAPLVIEAASGSLVRYMFDPSDKYADAQLREAFLTFVLNNLHHATSVETILSIIETVRPNNALYVKYSQVISTRLFHCLALSETPYFAITSITDVHRIYALIDRLHPASITPARWADALLSAPVEFVNAPASMRDDPLARRRTLLLRERMLDAADLRWLPALVILLRASGKIAEEAHISAARQSLYFSMHDAKSGSPAANVLSSLITKLIRNAVATFASHRYPSDPLFSCLINHALHYAGLFFNRARTPPTPSPSVTPSKPGLFLDSVRSSVNPSIISAIAAPLLEHGGTSTSIHAARFLMMIGRDSESWRGYALAPRWQHCGAEHFLTHHVVFLLYGQFSVIQRTPLPNSEPFLDKMVLLINETTVRRLIDNAVKVGNAAPLINHLNRIFERVGSNLDLRRKQKLLRLLSYLPSSPDTIALLITHFLQADDVALQVAGERILNLALNRLIDSAASPSVALASIQTLYARFMANFCRSTTNLQVQTLFVKLIKALAQTNPPASPLLAPTTRDASLDELATLMQTTLESKASSEPGFPSSVPHAHFISLLKSQYAADSRTTFGQLSILSQIDRDAVTQLLEADPPTLDFTLLPTFITSGYSSDFDETLLAHLSRKIDSLLDDQVLGEVGADPLKSGPPLLQDAVWEELRETTRCLASYINKFGSTSLSEAKLLRVSMWAFVESFRRWRAELINPYDFKLVLELSRSIVLHSSSSILTITDDFAWCSLLLCLYKFYCLVIRPHFGYIPGQRELEENYSQDPTQISLTQSTEMIKFLVSLLNNAAAYTPMNGSHIGQLIFDSFLRAIAPLATKAIDFVFPGVEAADLEEFGGGIIPNCPLFATPPAPEQSLRSFVRYINFVGLTDASQFDQIWRILEPIFVAPLGDAEMGSDEITEESKCLALAGITLMIVKACFETSDINASVNLLETSAIPPPTYNHVPREKELIFLGTNSGRKLNRLLSIIYAATPQAELPYGGSGYNAEANSISAYHYNIERRAHTSRYTSGQISLADLRQFRVPTHLGINFSPIIEKLINTFESFLINTMCPPLLRKEILKAVVLLSDLFNRDQYTWMYRTFSTIQAADDNSDDFLVRQHLLLGICKGLAVLQPTEADPQHPVVIYEMLKTALEHPNISLQQSALDGILYLLEGKVNRYILGPLLQFLFRWIPARLSSTPFPPIPLTLRALATMFLIIEQYSRESEENSFTKRAVIICTTLGQPSSPLPIAYGIFRGLDRLLVSFSLSHSQREYISHFALKTLPLDNPIRSLLGLGLMVTCMYTGDETGSSSMTPSINGKNTMMSSPTTSSSMLSFSGNISNGGGGTPLDSPLSFSSDLVFEQEDMFNIDSTERQHFSQVNNMEKVKMLFDKIKLVSHYSYETLILSEVIPTVIVDLYPSVDQILSFILGEFLKQSKSNPKLMCQIISRVFGLLIEKDQANQDLIYYWIIICLQNFFQIQNPVHCQWALTYLFLCSSPLKSFKLLSSEFSSKIQSNEKLFLISAVEFYYNSKLSQDNKKLFIDSFSKLKDDPYVSLLKLLDANKSK